MDSLACDPSHVTGIIEKLLQMGLVVRNECPDDRRKKRVQLSEEGRKRIGQVINVIPKRSDGTVVTQAEIADLRRLLLKLNESFAEIRNEQSLQPFPWAPPYVPSSSR
jgi:DNA-binding MarR family transcriptional regulator